MKLSRLVSTLVLAWVACARALAAADAPPSGPRGIPPAYPVSYGAASVDEIAAVLGRVLVYLEGASAVRVIDRDSGAPVTDLAHLPDQVAFAPTEFLLTSYEWGVTYRGMLACAQATGDVRYRDYVAERFRAIAAVAAHLGSRAPVNEETAPGRGRLLTLRNVLAPRSLDDSGAMDAAMIEAARAGILADELRPCIDRYTAWIAEKQFRLPDGTLARNRPHPRTLWLDDLYMSVPALAQMSALTGDTGYLDDAVRQVLQFSGRMFVAEVGLYRHGWVEAMDPHPAFYWSRANGWAVLAMAELLTILPEAHPSHRAVLAQFRAHVAGLAARQSDRGLWHQLLDRPETFLETSGSAMFCYAIARGINRGWLDRLAYGPMASLAWNAVAQQVNAAGQVENTCVGTGMGFDPAFYAYRPVSVYAAHGYGPVLLAGAEMIRLARGAGAEANINDGSLQYAPSPSRH